MQKMYKSHPEKLALIQDLKTLKEDLELTITLQHCTFSNNQNSWFNNPRSWDTAVNNYLEAIWINENRY